MANATTENKKRFLQNDRLLVCGMLVFYGFCILGLAGAAAWWLNQRNQTLSTNATSTAAVLATETQIIATEQARGTATAVAHSTELTQYEFFEPFNSNINRWRSGEENNDYWRGSTQVTSGVYIWDIREVKMGFIDWADFPGHEYIKNYDVYVDTKFTEAPSDGTCSGLIFRKDPLGWDIGGYSFFICKAGFFRIYYHNEKDGWQEIHSQYQSAIRPLDWNRLEVLVNDSHFVFLINGEIVYEMDDKRQTTGGVALMIDPAEDGTKILFDNFGYQSR